MLQEEGIILRNLKGFGLPECVRVTIGTDLETSFFITALDNYNRKKCNI